VSRPIEAAVILPPIFEFLHGNPMFTAVFTEPLSADGKSGDRTRPLPLTLITLTSYMLTHATSSSSPRAVAYANLSLNILSVFVESSGIMDLFCESRTQDVRLCRQVGSFSRHVLLPNHLHSVFRIYLLYLVRAP
jgi:hypothetical protein